MAVVIQLFAFLGAPLASHSPLRGQSPECQERCLTQHTEKMRRPAEWYGTSKDKLHYQDEVESLGLEYEKCLENCRTLYPVK